MLKNRGILPLKSVNEKFEPIIVKRTKKLCLSPKKVRTEEVYEKSDLNADSIERTDVALLEPINSAINGIHAILPSHNFNITEDAKQKIDIVSDFSNNLESQEQTLAADVPAPFVDQFPPLCVKIETHDCFDEQIRMSLENVEVVFS